VNSIGGRLMPSHHSIPVQSKPVQTYFVECSIGMYLFCNYIIYLCVKRTSHVKHNIISGNFYLIIVIMIIFMRLLWNYILLGSTNYDLYRSVCQIIISIQVVTGTQLVFKKRQARTLITYTTFFYSVAITYILII